MLSVRNTYQFTLLGLLNLLTRPATMNTKPHSKLVSVDPISPGEIYELTRFARRSRGNRRRRRYLSRVKSSSADDRATLFWIRKSELNFDMYRLLTRGENGLVELYINDHESRANGCCMLVKSLLCLRRWCSISEGLVFAGCLFCLHEYIYV